jgi:hypothetical protein
VIEGYHETRLAADPRRGKVWQALWTYFFRHRIRPEDCVLDLGAGYGDFINNVRARRGSRSTSGPDMPSHVEPGVETIVGPSTTLNGSQEGSVDFAFASNLFEHVPQSVLAAVLEQLRTKLSTRGTLTILQPNYRYAYREYFDDYTHVAVYTHASLGDFLRANGWQVLETYPRFLPLSVKSRLPTWPLLVAAYLRSPFKPLGKQMLLVARPSGT